MDYTTYRPFDSRSDEEKDWQQRLRDMSLEMGNGAKQPSEIQNPGFERQPDYSLMTASNETQQPVSETPVSDDVQSGDAVDQAQQMLQEQMTGDTAGVQSWQEQLNETLNQILNRKPFQYDLNGDALYQQYKDQYMLQGQQAMMDTMGQAAGMTGGYGNSYAQSVGQQAYNSHVQQLGERIPELYSLALSRYQNDDDALLDRYAILNAERDYEDAQSGGSGNGDGGAPTPAYTDPFAGKDLRSLLAAAGNKQAALALAEQMAQWGYADEAYALYQELFDKPASGGGNSSTKPKLPKSKADRIALS